MSFLDPAKLLLVLVVALVVLGPDKLPAAARKAHGLLADFKRWRSMIETEVRRSVDDLGLPDEVRNAGRALDRARSMDPRRSLADLLDGSSSNGDDGRAGTAAADAPVASRALQASRSPERIRRAAEDRGTPVGRHVPVSPGDPGLN